eukprot:896109-Rhodomonas_salina.1
MQGTLYCSPALRPHRLKCPNRCSPWARPASADSEQPTRGWERPGSGLIRRRSRGGAALEARALKHTRSTPRADDTCGRLDDEIRAEDDEEHEDKPIYILRIR